MDAEYGIGRGDRPNLSKGLVEIGHAVQARRDPVARLEHRLGDPRVGGVYVVQQRGRARDRAQKDCAREG